MNRKRIILAALLGVLVVCMFYAYLATPRLEKAPPRTSKPKARTATRTDAPKPGGDEGRVDFGFLTAEPQKYSRAERDIFNYGGRHIEVTKAPPVVPKPVVPEPVVTAPVPVETVPVSVVNKSLSRFTFLGFLEKAGEKTVFLSSSGNLFLVKSGERFGAENEFLVVEIKGNILKVSHAGLADLIEVPLIEQQKLTASVSAPAHIAPRAAADNQPRPRTFAPNKRMPRQDLETNGENPPPEMNQEDNPDGGQETATPENGDALEGEVNGTNQ